MKFVKFSLGESINSWMIWLGRYLNCRDSDLLFNIISVNLFDSDWLKTVELNINTRRASRSIELDINGILSRWNFLTKIYIQFWI
jgi:hypothetical protein